MQPILILATDRSRLFYLFLFAFIGLFLAGSLSGLLFGIEPDHVAGVWELRAKSFLQALLMFLFPAYTVFAWSFPKPFHALRLEKQDRLSRNIFVGFAILLVAYPFTSFLVQLNKGMILPESMSAIEQWMRSSEESAKNVTAILLSDKSVFGLIVNLLLVAGFASLAEEFFFRGALQQFLQNITKNGHIAVWLSAFIFSAIHLQFYGFLPRLVLGALLGYLFYYSGNLWVSIGAHFLNNTIVILMMYYRNFDAQTIDKIDNLPITPLFTLIAIASAFFTVLLFMNYRKKNKENKNSTKTEKIENL